MAIKLSTGLRNHLAVTGSVRNAIQGMVLVIYAGTEPSTADSAIPGDGVALATISTGGTGAGLNFETVAVQGVLTKAAADTWQGTNAANGTATYYRLQTGADDGSLSDVLLRVQGKVGTINADLFLSSVALVQSAVQRIGSYTLTVPAQ